MCHSSLWVHLLSDAHLTHFCVYYHTNSHPGCTCNLGYEGKYCELNENRKNLNGTASKAFLGFTITLFGLFAIFLAVYYSRAEKVSKPDFVHLKLRGAPPDILSSDCSSGYDGTVFLD